MDIPALLKKYEKMRVERKKINPIHEIVNTYYEMVNKHQMKKEFYVGRYAYGKLAKEAKELLAACKDDLSDALWALDKMRYKAEKGGFDWSISTCLKHDLTYR